MSIRYIPPIVVPAVKAHTATVIFVHGLGDSGAGWVDFAENWRRRSMFNETKFVFPNAPMIPITIVSTITTERVNIQLTIP
jgi:predicted esterase